MKVAVIGLGYVGTVTAACLACHGHDVWGVDVDAAKTGEIRAGRSPVELFGDYLAEQNIDDPRLQAMFGQLLDEVTSAAGDLAESPAPSGEA